MLSCSNFISAIDFTPHNSLRSSAYNKIKANLVTSGKLLINNINKREPITLPWITPLGTEQTAEIVPSMQTNCFLSLKKSANYKSIYLLKP